jgi:hypothetical protein
MAVLFGQGINHLDEFEDVARRICEIERMNYFPFEAWIPAPSLLISDSSTITEYIRRPRSVGFIYIAYEDKYYIHPESLHALYLFILDKNEK